MSNGFDGREALRKARAERADARRECEHQAGMVRVWQGRYYERVGRVTEVLTENERLRRSVWRWREDYLDVKDERDKLQEAVANVAHEIGDWIG